MVRILAISFLALTWICSNATTGFAQESLSAAEIASLRSQAETTLKRASTYFQTQVATHGGYVYHYDLSLDQRWGEGKATKNQIWIQPPGTPAVGLAYVAAFNATGDAYYLNCVQETAEAVIYGQLRSGGWTNCVDFDPKGNLVADYRNGRGRGRNNSSLDDGQTQTAIHFLVRADEAFGFKNAAIHDAASIALDALLAAQFPCGAFPQVWTGPVESQPPQKANYPDYDWRTEGRIKEYWNLYTLNDNVAVYVTHALLAAHEVYSDEKYLNAVKRLGDFLILSQMPQPQPAWAQQYNYAMQPVWARRFEPPAISGHESQAIVRLLMEIADATGERRYLEPIQPALDFLRASTLSDGRIARYYELKTNRPLYMERSGDNYKLTYDDSNLPKHYGWKTDSQVAKLQRAYDNFLQPKRPSAAEDSMVTLVQKVGRIIEDLDTQGRWVSKYGGERLVGQPKMAMRQAYLSSQVFNDNVQALSAFLEATR